MRELFDVGTFKDFTPSTGTMRKILGVRVYPPFTGHPGLLSISRYSDDVLKTTLALVLELIGLLVILYVAIAIRHMPSHLVIAFVVVLFFCDIIMMWFHHNYSVISNKILFFQNAIYGKSPLHDEKLQYRVNEDKIKSNKTKSAICKAALIFIAFVKIVAVYMLYPISRGDGDNPFMILLLLFLIYGLVAAAHINVTGYAVYGYMATRSFQNELSSFADRQGDRGEDFIPIEDNYSLPFHAAYKDPRLASLDDSLHRISIRNNAQDADRPNFSLEREGLLLDRQVATWATKARSVGDDTAELHLVKAAMRLQLALAIVDQLQQKEKPK